jgi:hypothetical protein
MLFAYKDPCWSQTHYAGFVMTRLIYILYRFPSQYFAVLYGITMIAAGVFSLFQYALFSWAEAYFKAPFHVS